MCRHGPFGSQSRDFARETLSKVSLPGNNHAAIGTPDGARLVLSSDMDGSQSNLWWARPDVVGETVRLGAPERLAKSDGHQDPGSLSPDGKFLVYAEADAAAHRSGCCGSRKAAVRSRSSATGSRRTLPSSHRTGSLRRGWLARSRPSEPGASTKPIEIPVREERAGRLRGTMIRIIGTKHSVPGSKTCAVVATA